MGINMPIEIGSRVAYVLDKKPLLGTVINVPSGGNALVSLDKVKTFKRGEGVSIPEPLLTPINVMTEAKRGFDYSKIKPTNKTPLQLFTQTGSRQFSLIAGRAMWSWVNFHVFHGKLQHYPVFIDKHLSNASKTYEKLKKIDPTGVCYMEGNTVYIYLSMKAFININAMWATVCHEMVHQYCFENNENDGHGPYFQRWYKPFKEICHVDITQYHYKDADAFAEDQGEDKDTVPEFYILLMSSGGVFVGIAAKNIEILREIRSNLPAGYKFYFRKSNSATIYNYMNFAKTSRIKNLNTLTKAVPYEMAKSLINDSQYQLESRVRNLIVESMAI